MAKRELIRLARVIERVGLPAGTVHSMRHRGQFPEPDIEIDGTNFWWWPDVWHRLTGGRGRLGS